VDLENPQDVIGVLIELFLGGVEHCDLLTLKRR
jgi:hypothetical protein